MNMETAEAQIEHLNSQISELYDKIAPLNAKKREIQKTIDKENSRIFIKENGITRYNTQSSNDKNMELFGHISKFADWLRDCGTCQWCEWNGRIFLVKDVIAGKFEYTDARYEDLQ